ncbi:MAG: hypothetical protein UIL37_03250 [Clostridia bacterium]|nr:hypothetical protein [Clostridia bacterium]
MNLETLKDKSLLILKLLIAGFIIGAPSVLWLMGEEAAVYFTFTVFSLLSALRIYANGKLWVSPLNYSMTALLIYAALLSLFAKNHEGNLIYICSLAIALLFITVFFDYLRENTQESMDRRLKYMLVASGAAVCCVNFIYWFFVALPVGDKFLFNLGFGSNDLLAIFIFAGIWSAVMLFNGASAAVKRILVILMLPMIAAWIMASSAVSYVFAGVIIVGFIVYKKAKIAFIPAAILCSAVLLIVLYGFFDTSAFNDAFLCGIHKPFGVGGGGFLSGQEMYASRFYDGVTSLGLLANVVSSSGIFGFIILLILFLREMYLLIKKQLFFSFVSLLTFCIVLFVPFTDFAAAILFASGTMAYNEFICNGHISLQLNEKKRAHICIALTAAGIISATLMCHALIRMNGDRQYNNKNYSKAQDLYTIAANINITDAKSCRGIVSCMLDMGLTDEQKALEYSAKAGKREKNNVTNMVQTALIMHKGERYKESAQIWKELILKAPHNDNYKVMYAETLYEIVQSNERGSKETKDAYREIVNISEKTADLDAKKEINDLADKAQEFNKGVLINEGEAIN